MLFIKNIALLLLIFQMSGNTILNEAKKKIDNSKLTEAGKLLDQITVDKLTPADKANYYYLKADLSTKINEEAKAYEYYLLSKKQYAAIGNVKKAMEINLDIAFLISGNEHNKNNYESYINEYLTYAKKTKDSLILARGYSNLGIINAIKNKNEDSREAFRKALIYIKNTGNDTLESSIRNNISVLFNERLNQPDSALFYLKEDLNYIHKKGSVDDYYHNYVNQASSYYHIGDYGKAIEYLKKADSIPKVNSALKAKQYVYEFMSANYDSLRDYKNAYRYSQLVKQFADSSNIIEQNIAINDIQTKYQTREKELENQVLKSKNKINKALLYTFTGLLIASIIIGLLYLKNARRKVKISQQEKLIEQQKLEKALKDHELNSIDIMLEGQERERQRIANDLHDNLGSMLATLKMNFEHLKLRKSDLLDEETKIYDRTDELIEEAYQKVRRLAHAKNAGVFASEGLIPALKKMADKISIPRKLQIQIIPFGFTERLENTLEIAIFRMVQELSTNIIKHSKATEASIQLTQHEDNINIIIEDNGVGFDKTKISRTDGMGLTTIRKKTEQLGGTFEIDATPGKGTTIIIDLPL